MAGRPAAGRRTTRHTRTTRRSPTTTARPAGGRRGSPRVTLHRVVTSVRPEATVELGQPPLVRHLVGHRLVVRHRGRLVGGTGPHGSRIPVREVVEPRQLCRTTGTRLRRRERPHRRVPSPHVCPHHLHDGQQATPGRRPRAACRRRAHQRWGHPRPACPNSTRRSGHPSSLPSWRPTDHRCGPLVRLHCPEL